jgi:3'-phosphoadenosine 5'-phosphosulfate sulfotransferase (PAPS reductase)/FAD synthetase/ubiquinone/menaquinone biosynthesis C-methylase UbiE
VIEAINHATDLALAQGLRVMQTHYFDGSQLNHCRRLLQWMKPRQGAHIVDAGSGIGEIARLMSEIRPDLRFTLVNISAYQLGMSPEGEPFQPILADFTASGLAAESADIVMFNSALCQMPINQALSEARRVLKPDGQLFISDLSLSEYRELPPLHATFMPSQQWGAVIQRHGFAETALVTFGDFDMRHFRDGYGERFDRDLPGALPFIGCFTKRQTLEHVAAVLARHDKIAFQLSGGKDSIAALYLLREHWPNLTVYWTNTGDPVPEVRAVIERIKAQVPHFVEIAGRVLEQIAAFGLPSDLVPTTSTPIGLSAYGRGTRLQDRFQCCYRSLMEPMQERMSADGITLIIRGQKTADSLKSPLRSGALEDGIELLFPLEDWSDDQVFAWLHAHAFVPDYYQQLSASPDCLTCSAYWSEGRAAWLKHTHPEAHAAYQGKLDVIREAVMPHIALFNLEVA